MSRDETDPSDSDFEVKRDELGDPPIRLIALRFLLYRRFKMVF